MPLPSLLRAPDAPAGSGSGGGAPAPSPSPNPADTQIPLKREEYDRLVAERSRAADLERELKAARENLSHVSTLLRPNEDPSKVQASIRRLMANEGYTPEQIDAYFQADSEPEPQPQGRGQRRQVEDEDEEQAAQFVHQTRQELSELREATKRQDRVRLDSLLQSRVNGALDSGTELGKLYAAVTQSLGSEGSGETEAATLREHLISDVRRETLDRLRARRVSSGGLWDDGWISEEAAKAAKAVYGKFKLLAPNPAKLGRLESLSDEQQYVQSNQQVKAPEWKRGKDLETVQRESRDWAVDQLLRASAEIERKSSDSPL